MLATSHPELRTGTIVTDLQAEAIVARICELIEVHVKIAILAEREKQAGGR